MAVERKEKRTLYQIAYRYISSLFHSPWHFLEYRIRRCSSQGYAKITHDKQELTASSHNFELWRVPQRSSITPERTSN